MMDHKFLVDELWHDLLNKDDRTSPADYPNMALITREEFEAYATEVSVEACTATRILIINAPETADFMAGVPIEAAHQRERWGSDHDAGKTPFDWFWLIGYLAQKAASSAVTGDSEKAMHHTISTAAALANWHAAISGASFTMRPGIAPPLDLDSLPLATGMGKTFEGFGR